MSDDEPTGADDSTGPGGGRAALANDAVRFVLELCLVVVAGWWGWWAGSSVAESLVLVILVPLAVCAVWAAFAAPRRPYRTPDWFPSVMFLVLTALAVGALVEMGHIALALALGTAAVVNEVLRRAGLSTVGHGAPRR